MANIVTKALHRHTDLHTHTHADKQKETLSRTVRDRDTHSNLGWEKQRKDEPLAVQIQNFIITKHVTGAISVQISVYLLATNSKTHEKGSRAERRLARYLTSFVSRCFNSAEWLHRYSGTPQMKIQLALTSISSFAHPWGEL